MSGHTETFIVVEAQPWLPAFKAIREILAAESVGLAREDYILLNDTEEEEFDLVEIPLQDEAAAMEQFYAHPGGGIVPFELEGSFFHVATTCLRNHILNGLSFWMFEGEYKRKREKYDRIIDTCHRRFQGLRTMQGWNMMDYVDSEECEIERVYQGIFEGTYDLDIRGDEVVRDTRKDI